MISRPFAYWVPTEQGSGTEWQTRLVRAVRNTPDGVQVLDVPAPNGPGVRIRVRSAGICGSDLEMIRTGLAVNTLGHEIAGATDDGALVAIHPVIACGVCDQCRAGAQQLCKVGGASLLGVFADGGMADEMVVDPSCLSPLPAGVAIEDASLVEPTAVALHACNRAGLVPGMRVGVVGAGTIGLLCGAVARHLGADVAIAPRHPAQQRAAEALALTVKSSRNCDVVFEAAGTASGFEDAAKRCRRRGTIVLVSTTWEPIPVSFLSAQLKEITLVPAYVYGEAHGHREFDTAVTILAAHPEIAPRVDHAPFRSFRSASSLQDRGRSGGGDYQSRAAPVSLYFTQAQPIESGMEGIAAIRARVQAIQSQFGMHAAGGVLGNHDPSTNAAAKAASPDNFAAALAGAQAVDPSVPASSGALNKAGVDPVKWARDFLTKAGMPVTAENVRAVKAWQQAEGTAAKFNPLATTQGGYAGSTNFNSVGVKNFMSYQDGIDANAKVLNNGLYKNIIAALQKGDNALDVALAIKNSPWGSGGLVEKIIRAQ